MTVLFLHQITSGRVDKHEQHHVTSHHLVVSYKAFVQEADNSLFHNRWFVVSSIVCECGHIHYCAWDRMIFCNKIHLGQVYTNMIASLFKDSFGNRRPAVWIFDEYSPFNVITPQLVISWNPLKCLPSMSSGVNIWVDRIYEHHPTTHRIIGVGKNAFINTISGMTWL